VFSTLSIIPSEFWYIWCTLYIWYTSWFINLGTQSNFLADMIIFGTFGTVGTCFTPAAFGTCKIGSVFSTLGIIRDPGHKARKNPSDNADLGFQAVGPALRIMQLNVEGL